MKRNDYLMHYASPYYDPIKAHEYYMRTRQLKGRTSTAGLNDSGKEAASYIKKKLNDERDAKIAAHKKKTNSDIASQKYQKQSDIELAKQKRETEKETLRQQKKRTMESHKIQMNAQIDSLRSILKNMSSAEKNANRKDKVALVFFSCLFSAVMILSE